MLTTIITATTLVTGITGTTLGIKAAVTDRRQDKNINKINESLKKLDNRMKTIESDCSCTAGAVQQLLAIAQQTAQSAAAQTAQPQPAAAPTPDTQPQQAEQPAAAPAAQQA